jgi:monoamine oxidase
VETLRVAIIGGGPGGLMTAYLLERRAPGLCSITLFEASQRLGGKVLTGRFASSPLAYEAGAAELYDYSALGPDPLRELIAELGLTTRPMTGEAVVMGDTILRTEADVLGAFGERTLKALQQFRATARSAISPAAYYESDWREDNADPMSRCSFRELLARVTDEQARHYLEASVHSDLATEPEHTSAAYGLQNYLMNEPDYMRLYTIDGGLERLPQELGRRLSCRVLLGQTVVRVERTERETYRVESRRGGEPSSEEFDFVAVALPNNWLPAIQWSGPQLAEAMRRHHAHYDYPAHYLRVSALFERPFWRDQIADSYFMLDAFGGCCVYDESSRYGGNGPGVLGWLLAGEAAVTLGNRAEAELVEAVLDALPRPLRHGRGLFREARVHRWLGSVNGLPGGRPMHEPDSRHVPEPAQHPWLFVVGDYLFDSTLNGVLDSADVVSEWIAEEIADYRLEQSKLRVPATADNAVDRPPAPGPTA